MIPIADIAVNERLTVGLARNIDDLCTANINDVYQRVEVVA